MRKLSILLLFILPFLVKAQDKGIHFEHGLTWEQVKAKAKAENKLIFIDCYATWCGPCKMMSNTVFPQEKAGTFFNKNFISVKLQFDTTAKDNSEVKAWHAVAADIQKKYEIKAFPTFLFMNSDGEAVHRMVGASSTADEFVALASDAIDPSKQYYTVAKKYNEGERDPSVLRNMAIAMLKEGNDTAAVRLTSEYIATQKTMFTKDNIQLISYFTRSGADNGFKFFYNNMAKVDSVMGPETAANILKPIIEEEEVNSKAFVSRSKTDWATVKANAIAKYPAMAQYVDKMVISCRIRYYSNTADWKNFADAAVDYMKSYGDMASPETLNNLAWDVFKNCTDVKYLTQAADWSKASFKGGDNPVYMDTYANILYKLGKKKEALVMENKAVALAGKSNNASYLETLNKMKKGLKTW
ncbi:thioredoxin family protein [Pedobacter paludis]|uniref:Thioredoxin domain-containing protein n=1 Tax=Pedobacter paludis TaxID=2203212 RepID=A0A317EVN1_9SPHI|nr:thioredoxin family protein [Pedobacter paludis]PWS30512.1 hypothetical protein DF947_16365 [Pedobacter paludis]